MPPESESYEHRILIDYESFERIIFILMVDHNMVVDENWIIYLKEIQEKCENNPNYILYPVAAAKTSYSLPIANIKSKNYIRLYEKKADNKVQYLILKLSHEICRFLYGIERISNLLKHIVMKKTYSSREP